MNKISLTTYSRYKISKLFYKKFCSKLPLAPIVLPENKPDKVAVNHNTIALLERLSLVKFDTSEGVKILEDSITFADKILKIDTDGVEPLYSVLDEENLHLREDKITQGNCQKDILRNASVSEDDYFVAPPGNIPLHEVEVEQQHSLRNDPKTVKQHE